METIKLTVGQAIVRFLDAQYIIYNGKEEKYVDGISVIFGHGIVIGLGEALANMNHNLKIYQGKNEQGMAHTAIGYTKEHLRHKIIAVSSSVGPGAANMVTAAATATANNLPLLLFPADTFASRQPDPVLQQIEQSYDLSITTNDAFRPVSKYFDRIVRPEQLMSSMIQAMRVLTNPAQMGAVTISLPQDVQGESYEYPIEFFKKRVHSLQLIQPRKQQIIDVVGMLRSAKKPLIICGGGVKYANASEPLDTLCTSYQIPFVETQAGKSTLPSSHEMNLGGVGVTGNLASNEYAKTCDLVIGIGTRYTDFTTGSKSLYQNAKIVNVNISDFHALKLEGLPVVSDAKIFLEELLEILKGTPAFDPKEVTLLKRRWENEYTRLTTKVGAEVEVENDYHEQLQELSSLNFTTLSQTNALRVINDFVDQDDVIVGASGSLPGDLQRMWKSKGKNTYHVEYGYSCMGYEVAATLGVKLAKPHVEAYCMVGDAAFMMMHSELHTSIQERAKIIVLLFDNMSNGCISNLQMGNGIPSCATDFKYRNNESNKLDGAFIPMDFAKIAEGYGCIGLRVSNEQELTNALKLAKTSTQSVLIDIKVLPKSMSNGYGAWWNIGLAELSDNEKVNRSYELLKNDREKARKY